MLPPFRGGFCKTRMRTADAGHNKNNDNKIIKNDISICRNILGNSSQNVRKVSKIAKLFLVPVG